MKPSSRLRKCVTAAFLLALLAPALPCVQAAETAAAATPVGNAGALNVTPPSAIDTAELTDADARADAESEIQIGAAPGRSDAPAASVFEDVLREQDPAEVPLSLALMGGVLGMLYIRRRKR